MYIIFNKTCLHLNKKTLFFIQSKVILTDVKINSNTTIFDYKVTKLNIIQPCYDYAIEILDETKVNTIEISLNNKLFYVKLHYPFEKLLESIKSNMNIISTMAKNYNHRLDEWIKYNLNLGFDKIIIYNNEENKSTNLNEGNDYYENMNIVTDKYRDSVYVIEFPYSPFNGLHWNNIQRMSLHLSLTLLNNNCNFCSFIDADEFIYINEKVNIKKFLQRYNYTLKMGSNIITNKNDNDAVYNNILSICNYVGEDKYTKLFIYMKNIPSFFGSTDDVKFLPNVHDTPYAIQIDNEKIMHFHCFVNKRYKYNKNQKYFSLIN